MPKGRLTGCVMCGGERVHPARVTVQLRNGRVARGISADVCPDCGERYYDMDAMRKIEEVRNAP